MFLKLRCFAYFIFLFVLCTSIVWKTFAGGNSSSDTASDSSVAQESHLFIVQKMLFACCHDHLDILCCYEKIYKETKKQSFNYDAFFPFNISSLGVLRKITINDDVVCAQATPLHVAIYFNSHKITNYLLKEKAVNIVVFPTVKIITWSPSLKARYLHNEKFLQLKSNYLERSCGLLTGTALHGNGEIAYYLLKDLKMFDIVAIQYAIYVAVISNKHAYLDKLLCVVPKVDINFSEQTTHGSLLEPGSFTYYTPLLAAIHYNYEDIIECLLHKKNINPNKGVERRHLVLKIKEDELKNDYEITQEEYMKPLTLAVMHNQPKTIRMLIDCGANTGIKSMQELLVHAASKNTYEAIIQILQLNKSAKYVLLSSENAFLNQCHPLSLAISQQCYDVAFVFWHCEYFSMKPYPSSCRLYHSSVTKNTSPPFMSNDMNNKSVTSYFMTKFSSEFVHQGEHPFLVACRTNNVLALHHMLHDGCNNVESLINGYYSVGDNIEPYMCGSMREFFHTYSIRTLCVTLLFAACQYGHWATVYYLLMQPDIDITKGGIEIMNKQGEVFKKKKQTLEALYTPLVAATLNAYQVIIKLLWNRALCENIDGDVEDRTLFSPILSISSSIQESNNKKNGESKKYCNGKNNGGKQRGSKKNGKDEKGGDEQDGAEKIPITLD